MAWYLDNLHRQAEAARRRSDNAALRAYHSDLNVVTQIVNEVLGVGKIVEYTEFGCAQVDAALLSKANDLREKLSQFGKCAIGAGLTIIEAKDAATFSFQKRNGQLVVWSSLMKEKDLDKSEEPLAPTLSIIDLESRLRACADKAIQQEKEKREQEQIRLTEAREKAYISVRALMRQNLLRQMKVEDPNGYKIVSDLMSQLKTLLQEPLSKAWTFKGLPIPHSRKAKGVPVGTVLKGKEKVSTPNGDEWKSVRSGKVMSAKPLTDGAKRGYATSNPEG